MSAYYLQTVSNEFFDMYYSCKEAKTIWEVLVTKFTAEDAMKQRFVMGKYNQWQMKDNKEMKYKSRTAKCYSRI